MTRSFFGGDPGVCHFKVDCPYRLETERYGGPAYGQDRQRRIEQRAKLKELGFPSSKYFQYRIGDEAGKKAARKQAEAYAKTWSKKAGFELEIAEGCFL